MDSISFLDSYIMHLLEEGLIRRWLCINKVGTGKTFTYLNAICLAVEKLKRRKANREKINAGPTLIVVPAYLVSQIFNEAFPSFRELKFKCLFRHKSAIPATNPRYTATINATDLDKLTVLWANAKSDLKTA